MILVTCPECYGKSKQDKSRFYVKPCERCGGTGRIFVSKEKAEEVLLQKRIDDNKL